MTRLAAALLPVALAACWSAAAADLPLSGLQWLAPGAYRVAALTMAPAECFRLPADSTRAAQAEAGRIVFRSPLLLGGPAARSGISCQTCHINGHRNPDFFIDGLSGAPGTVDVTSRRFSKTRGDDRFNPKRIPSLLELVPAVGTAQPARLATFVHGVIVDEFQGWQPAPTVMAALLAYVAALEPSACPSSGAVEIRLADDLKLIDRGASSLLAALQAQDLELADFLLVSLRSLLGDIDQRFESPGLESARAELRERSRSLAAWRDRLSTQPDAAMPTLVAWQANFRVRMPALAAMEPRTLYAPAILRQRMAVPASGE